MLQAKVLGDSNFILLEVDINNLADKQAASVITHYKDHDNLFNHIDQVTADMVARRAIEAGIPIEKIKQLKPWAVSVLFGQLDLKAAYPEGIVSTESPITDLAHSEKIELGYLESIKRQFVDYDSLDEKTQDALLRVDLNQHPTAEQYRVALGKIIDYWLAGDLFNMNAIMSALDGIPPELAAIKRKVMITDGNKTMVDRLMTDFFDKEVGVISVAVGANHFIDPEGINHLLKLRGFVIESA